MSAPVEDPFAAELGRRGRDEQAASGELTDGNVNVETKRGDGAVGVSTM